MNDDPIKLREALYAAEPFLTYMLKEATMERNNRHLEDALNKVRGALGMDPIQTSVRITDISVGENQITLVSLTENEDGSCHAEFDVSADATKTLVRIGLMKILSDAAEKYEEESDETGE